jgi:hypothetical protein
MIDHIGYDHPTYGQAPLCGAAMWDELVTEDHAQADRVAGMDVCWECASIVG